MNDSTSRAFKPNWTPRPVAVVSDEWRHYSLSDLKFYTAQAKEVHSYKSVSNTALYSSETHDVTIDGKTRSALVLSVGPQMYAIHVDTSVRFFRGQQTADWQNVQEVFSIDAEHLSDPFRAVLITAKSKVPPRDRDFDRLKVFIEFVFVLKGTLKGVTNDGNKDALMMFAEASERAEKSMKIRKEVKETEVDDTDPQNEIMVGDPNAKFYTLDDLTKYAEQADFLEAFQFMADPNLYRIEQRVIAGADEEELQNDVLRIGNWVYPTSDTGVYAMNWLVPVDQADEAEEEDKPQHASRSTKASGSHKMTFGMYVGKPGELLVEAEHIYRGSRYFTPFRTVMKVGVAVNAQERQRCVKQLSILVELAFMAKGKSDGMAKNIDNVLSQLKQVCTIAAEGIALEGKQQQQRRTSRRNEANSNFWPTAKIQQAPPRMTRSTCGACRQMGVPCTHVGPDAPVQADAPAKADAPNGSSKKKRQRRSSSATTPDSQSRRKYARKSTNGSVPAISKAPSSTLSDLSPSTQAVSSHDSLVSLSASTQESRRKIVRLKVKPQRLRALIQGPQGDNTDGQLGVKVDELKDEVAELKEKLNAVIKDRAGKEQRGQEGARAEDLDEKRQELELIEERAEVEKAEKEAAEKEAAAQKVRSESLQKQTAAQKARAEGLEKQAAAEKARAESLEKQVQDLQETLKNLRAGILKMAQE
ncbi:hypothetical protein P280DRAFT_545775 [Massarina eburnea CBS 473.64]|uniref:Uncharacterized protein n=1 Tax=Massarina eburnea CBS 473.64 TaxID=1395130 RepID=A0A6A6SI03_9PLEO|nr:hypothetical protein P280DRAFT_545775 [Massarina eburnea CBS 473.64]